MGACASLNGGDPKTRGLRSILSPGFVHCHSQQRALRDAVFPLGLAEPLPEAAFFSVLRLEAEPLPQRLYALARGETREASLGAVLLLLANAAAGEPLCLPPEERWEALRTGAPAPLPLDSWELAQTAAPLHAAFAFELYDLDGSGDVSLEEVTALVSRTLQGATGVTSARRALAAAARAGGGRQAPADVSLQRGSFARMAANAPGFLYPAVALQAVAVRAGRHAAASLAALARAWGTLAGPPPLPPPLTPTASPPPSAPLAWASRDEAGSSVLSDDAAGGEADVQTGAFRAARLGRISAIDVAVRFGNLSLAVPGGPHGGTLLHVAAAHGHTRLCKRLLALDAPADARDALGRSAAEVALLYRHFETASLLAAAGVPVSPQVVAAAAAEHRAWQAREAAGEPSEAEAAQWAREWGADAETG